MSEFPVRTGGLVKGQTEVRISKFGPFLEHESISRAINLPSGYGKDRIVAMTRDPWWIFIYWEITPSREAAVKKELEQEKGEQFDKSILRIFDVTGIDNFTGANANAYFDIALKDLARSWYVDINHPGRSWIVEIGLISKEGNFYALARSNIVRTPNFKISDILDEEWMAQEEDYWLLFGISEGFGVGKSSFEIKQLLQKHFKEWISSAGLRSLASHVLHQKQKRD